MIPLLYKTRNNIHPQGLPKVYLCGVTEDKPQLIPKKSPYFDKITSQILQFSNCAIWYRTEPISQHDMKEHLDMLGQMQLFVMPVTRKLLTEPNQTLDVEFRFAMERHIPVLPLMQEPNLVCLFSQKCGDIQFLDETAEDATAIAYMDKLEKYLHSVLTDDSLIRKIRNAFDAYIFLSYRKKDRKYAQDLMNMIHRNPRYRGVAIWYDEFLVPGEDFNDNIFEALKKSALFAMTVTPNLLENGNYVMTQEYPEALREQKPIVPFELSPTDINALRSKYRSFPACVNPEDQTVMDQTLQAHLKHIALGVDDGAEHTFLLGLAYLEGIDVETDREYGIKLIRAAAERNLLEAIEKLTVIYAKGKGVPQDYQQVIFWQKKLVQLRLRAYQTSVSLQNGMDLLTDLSALADLLSQCGDMQSGVQYYSQALSCAQELSKKYNTPELTLLHSSALINVADVIRAQEDYAKALDLYDAAHSMLSASLSDSGIKFVNGAVSVLPENPTAQMIHLLSNALACWVNRIDMHLRLAYEGKSTSQMQTAENLLQSLKRILLDSAVKNRLPNYPRFLSILYSRLGELKKCQGDYTEAKGYYKQALELDQSRLKLIVEDRDFNALDDYALSCFDLAWVDPQKVELNYLKDAFAIWQWLKDKLPFMPIYADRLADLEAMILQQEPAFNPRSVSIERIFLQTQPVQKTVTPEHRTSIEHSTENKKQVHSRMKTNDKASSEAYVNSVISFLEQIDQDVKNYDKHIAGADETLLTVDEIRERMRGSAKENDKTKKATNAAYEDDRIKKAAVMHQELLARAEKDDKNAIYRVACNYLEGNGVEASIADAEKWGWILARLDDPRSYYIFYEIHLKRGQYEVAKKMLKSAAKEKLEIAYLRLSECYKSGRLFKKNKLIAFYWWKKFERAERRLGKK